jgi:hypothetical protein
VLILYEILFCSVENYESGNGTDLWLCVERAFVLKYRTSFYLLKE